MTIAGLEACADRFDDTLRFMRVAHSDGLGARLEQSPQGIVHRSDRHLGCLPAVAAREPSDVARCYELGFSADRALALQDDNDRVATRQYRAMSPVLG